MGIANVFKDYTLRYAKPVLIVVEGAQTSAGGRDREDPAGRKPEEASAPPAKCEAPETKINSRMQNLKIFRALSTV